MITFRKNKFIYFSFLYQYILFVIEIHREEEFEPLLGDGKPDKKSTDSLEMEEINHRSQIRRNSKSHEVQLPTSSLNEDKATKVQGIDANH